jgi:HSP20 family protein
MSLLTQSRKSGLAPVDRLRNEFERGLQNLWNDGMQLENVFSSGDWIPQVDVSESEDGLQVKVDLPGIKPDDVEISVSDGRMTIQGERKEEKETKDKSYRRVERSYGSFYRVLDLPPGTDADNVSAAAEDGVITITVPKSAEAKAKTIKIKPK